jgi:hypothetical protein
MESPVTTLVDPRRLLGHKHPTEVITLALQHVSQLIEVSVGG